MAAPAPQSQLHPNLARIYRDKVENLLEALNNEATQAEAGEAAGPIQIVR